MVWGGGGGGLRVNVAVLWLVTLNCLCGPLGERPLPRHPALFGAWFGCWVGPRGSSWRSLPAHCCDGTQCAFALAFLFRGLAWAWPLVGARPLPRLLGVTDPVFWLLPSSAVRARFISTTVLPGRSAPGPGSHVVDKNLAFPPGSLSTTVLPVLGRFRPGSGGSYIFNF